MSFYDSGAFGCLVWALLGALFYGISRLLLPLIELVPVPSSARELLLILWTLCFVVSSWCLFLGCVVGSAKVLPALAWVAFGGLETFAASITLFGAYILAGHRISKDWQFLFGLLVLLVHLCLIFLPTWKWFFNKRSPDH